MSPDDSDDLKTPQTNLNLVAPRTRRLLTFYLCAMTVGLCSISYLSWSVFDGSKPVDNASAMLIVSTAGALGGLIHACRSFYFHAIEETVTEGRAYKYVLRPFTGAALALIFYYAIAGSLATSPTTNKTLVGYAAIAALVGMFTDQAAAKLKTIAEGILSKP